MAVTMQSIDAVTKQMFGPRVVDQVENEITLTRRIEKTSKGTGTDEVGGKYCTFPLKVRRNHGIGYRNEMEQLQAPGQQGWTNVRVPLRYGYGRVHLSGQAMKLARTNKQSFVNIMTAEMEGLKDDIAKDTNRILWGNQVGKVATLDAGNATNTLTVTSGFRYLSIGYVVDIMDVSSLPTTIATNRKITAIDVDNETITIDGAAVTVAAGDFLVRQGNYMKEPHGLQSLVNNNSDPLFNLSKTQEPLWQSVVDSTGGNLSENAMITMCDRLRQNGGTPTVIFTDLATRRAYLNLLTAQRRYTNTTKFDGGFTGVAFSYDHDIPVVTDVDAVEGAMWFLREPDFKVYEESKWSWEDTDGSVWKWVTNYDAFEALMKKYWEFAIQRRNTQGVMTGITPG